MSSMGSSWVASWVTEAVEDKPSAWTREKKSTTARKFTFSNVVVVGEPPLPKGGIGPVPRLGRCK